jgi:hypothetical protein
MAQARPAADASVNTAVCARGVQCCACAWKCARMCNHVPRRPSATAAQCHGGPVPRRPSATAAQCHGGPVPRRPSATAAQCHGWLRRSIRRPCAKGLLPLPFAAAPEDGASRAGGRGRVACEYCEHSLAAYRLRPPALTEAHNPLGRGRHGSARHQCGAACGPAPTWRASHDAAARGTRRRPAAMCHWGVRHDIRWP